MILLILTPEPLPRWAASSMLIHVQIVQQERMQQELSG